MSRTKPQRSDQSLKMGLIAVESTNKIIHIHFYCLGNTVSVNLFSFLFLFFQSFTSVSSSCSCDTGLSAGMTEGGELGNKTNCLHFLRLQPLRGAADEHYTTNLQLRKIQTRLSACEVKGTETEKNLKFSVLFSAPNQMCVQKHNM